MRGKGQTGQGNGWEKAGRGWWAFRFVSHATQPVAAASPAAPAPACVSPTAIGATAPAESIGGGTQLDGATQRRPVRPRHARRAN